MPQSAVRTAAMVRPAQAQVMGAWEGRGQAPDASRWTIASAMALWLVLPASLTRKVWRPGRRSLPCGTYEPLLH